MIATIIIQFVPQFFFKSKLKLKTTIIMEHFLCIPQVTNGKIQPLLKSLITLEESITNSTLQ